MKKFILIACFIALLGICPRQSSAQDTDYGTWLSADVSKGLTKKLDLEFEEEARIFQNFSEIDRFETSLGGVYSFRKYLKGGAGYTWIYRHNVKKSYWENRNRYYIYLSGKAELGRFTFALREKFQSTYYSNSDYNPRNYLRSRLEVSWDIKKCKAEPYISTEMHYQLNNPDGNEIDNMRYTAGVEFPLTKKLDLNTYLRLNQDIHVKNPVSLYLLGINMKLKL